MTIGDFSPFADKATLDAVLSKVNTLSPGALPAAVWNAPKLGNWTLTGVENVEGLKFPSTVYSESIAASLGNVGQNSSVDGEWYGAAFRTTTDPVKLKSFMILTPVARSNLRVKITVMDYPSDANPSVVYDSTVNAAAGTGGTNFDIQASNIIIQPNKKVIIEYPASGQLMYATAGGIAWNTNMTRTKAVGMGATARGSEFGTVNITAGQYYGVDGQIQTVPVSIGNALSPTISRSGVHTWGKLSTLADIPANSSILFDVEKTDGTKLLTDLSNGADLSSLPLYDIKIRAKFSRTDTAVQPILKSLMLDWIGSQNTKRMAKRIVFSTSSASYATALSVAGSGRLVGLITSGAGSYTPYVKATLDGVLISWAKGPTSGGAMPVAQWSSMTDGMSTAYSSTGENTNCQFGFNNSLLIEVAAASGTVSVTVFYEIDE